jgi:kinetochore protein Fta7
MARTSTSSIGSKPAGINRKATIKASRNRKSGQSRRTSTASSRRTSTNTDFADSTIPDLEDVVTEDEDQSAAQQSRPYVYLKPRTARIPQEKITSEWKSLNSSAVERVADILTVARRNVISSVKTKKRANEVEKIVDGVQQLLQRRLPRMPFPPKTKEINFDLEKLLDQRRGLESEMSTLIHSIELLKGELHKEEELTAQNQHQLEMIQKDAKLEDDFWRKKVKKNHSILSIDQSLVVEDGPDEIGFVPQETVPSIMDYDDEDLSPILSQLNDHLESIRTNHIQVEGIGEAIREAGIAVDSLMHQTF